MKKCIFFALYFLLIVNIKADAIQLTTFTSWNQMNTEQRSELLQDRVTIIYNKLKIDDPAKAQCMEGRFLSFRTGPFYFRDNDKSWHQLTDKNQISEAMQRQYSIMLKTLKSPVTVDQIQNYDNYEYSIYDAGVSAQEYEVMAEDFEKNTRGNSQYKDTNTESKDMRSRAKNELEQHKKHLKELRADMNTRTITLSNGLEVFRENEESTEGLIVLLRKIKGDPEDKRADNYVENLMVGYIIHELCGDVTSTPQDGN